MLIDQGDHLLERCLTLDQGDHLLELKNKGQVVVFLDSLRVLHDSDVEDLDHLQILHNHENASQEHLRVQPSLEVDDLGGSGEHHRLLPLGVEVEVVHLHSLQVHLVAEP